MKNIIITQLTFEEIKQGLRDELREELASLKADVLFLKEQLECGVKEENEIYYDKKQAAKVLNCSISLIDKLRRNGSLNRYTIGGSVRFKKTDILALTEKKKNPSPTDFKTNFKRHKKEI